MSFRRRGLRDQSSEQPQAMTLSGSGCADLNDCFSREKLKPSNFASMSMDTDHHIYGFSRIEREPFCVELRGPAKSFKPIACRYPRGCAAATKDAEVCFFRPSTTNLPVHLPPAATRRARSFSRWPTGWGIVFVLGDAVFHLFETAFIGIG